METAYDTFDVPMRGGDLRVGRWAGVGTPVLAVHGVTANHRSWPLVADRVGAPVLAPDLRGRGRSGDLPGPAGMDAHVEDLVAVLDAAGVDRAVLVGHSMGGFVVAALAEAAPERVAGVVLVDGGLPFPAPPPGVTPDEVISATIGPAAERLGRTFTSIEDYLDYWRDHPALAPSWSSTVEDYLAYDLVGDPPECRSSVSLDRVREDSVPLMDGDVAARRVRALPPGSLFLRAPAGLLAEPAGLYPVELVARHHETFPDLAIREIPDVNHYTILLDSPGAQAVARAAEEQGAGA